MKDYRSRGQDGDGGADQGGIAPGKRTRTQAIQRRSAPEGGGGAGEAAPKAAAGSGGLPPAVQDKMEGAFDFDFSGVRVHEGAEAQGMGALAYTQGADVHFAPGQYDPSSAGGQELIGHELAHVVQQSEGRVQPTTQMKGVGLNDDSALEQEADNWGARAARGESIDRGGSAASATGGSGAPVQRFRDFKAEGEPDAATTVHWAAPGGTALRVADDGTAAVAQDSLAGSQEMYLLASRLPAINADLKTAHAPLILVTTGGAAKGGVPANLDAGSHTLSRVKPVDAANEKKDKEIPNDCGNAARTVTGATADGKNLHAEYVGKDGTKQVSASGDPEMMKYEIMVNHFGDKIPGAKTILTDVQAALSATSDAYDGAKDYFDALKDLNEAVKAATLAADAVLVRFQNLTTAHKAKVDAINASGAANASEEVKALEAKFATMKAALQTDVAAVKKAYDEANATYQAFLAKKVGAKTVREILIAYSDAAEKSKTLVDTIMLPYNGMAGGDQEAFDDKVGINRHADPGVGEAYTISSGGPAKRDDRTTWNFHWGGVIFKSTTGSDNITMENYAGNADSEWYFQMYGVPTKGDARKGQTFNEQHRDEHEQHGTTPTTLSTEKR